MDKHFTLISRDRVYVASSRKRETLVGQTENCDFVIANPTQYIDRLAAKIVENADGDGWHLVRLNGFDIHVNGVAVNRVHYLSNGDLIDFGGKDGYRFNIVEGETDKPSLTVVKPTGQWVMAVAALCAAILLAVVWLVYAHMPKTLTDSQIAEAEMSLYRLELDSVTVWENDSLIEVYQPVNIPVGTAFLTTDSLIVTARHCVEPWLNKVKPNEIPDIPEMDDQLVKMALRAETVNQIEGEETMRLISHFTLTDHEGQRSKMASTDFRINHLRDEIIEMGDYDNDMYWRSVSRRHGREDMMLGDVAVAKADKAGNIKIADYLTLKSLLKKRTPLTFIGFPMSETGPGSAEVKSAELTQPLSEIEPETPGMLIHGGAMVPGYSGAPVLTRDGAGYVLVGVVSVLDAKNGERSYSVPSTEILKL